MIDRYILKDGIAYPCEDLIEWAEWMGDSLEKAHRTDKVGGLRLSTIFLGLNTCFDPNSPPLLWESMLFDDEAAHEVEWTHDGVTSTYLSVPDLGQWRFSFQNDAYEFHDEKLAELQDAFDHAKAPFLFGEHKES